ncbi:hypothetical protein [Microbacterium sp. SLBN-111]|uniref:hypothetical protein n=1 Tax=Microbacterium sp. SLBN-111 TaxID=3377733 RepID=UPI003C7943B6
MTSFQAAAVDVAWEGLPNWISAVTGTLTLFAAITAAVFAGWAAHWAKQQAEAARAQTHTATEQLHLARDEATEARRQLDQQERKAVITERRQTEARLDTIAPLVIATARRHNLMRSFQGSFVEVKHRQELEAEEDVFFRTSAAITFRNLSSTVARIDVVDSAQGELSVRSGEGIILSPGEQTQVSWQRVVARAALRTPEDLGRREHWLMTVEFWVRDLGMNVRDTFRFGGDFRHFRLDGSRLIVDPTPQFPWEDNVAEPTGPRIYERLDAGLSGISPAS